MHANIPIQKHKRSGVANPVFTILIPSWNNLPYLRLCIESIRRNSRFAHQVVVHVNVGEDGTLDWLATRPDIDYTYSKENIGICYPLNIARSLADTEYILYMNDDMYACPDWDLPLLNEIKAIGHNYFFLSATLIEPFVSANNCVIVKDYGTAIENFQEQSLLDECASLPRTDWQGATWPPNVVHRDVWDLVGGYSMEFSPGMYSDPDFSMKLWVAGVRFFKGVSSSRFYHFGSKSIHRVVKNKGYYTFITKWGLTSGTFTRHYLRIGMLFNGALPDPILTRKLRWKNLFKRLATAFQGR